jgi:hypothetical protein
VAKLRFAKQNGEHEWLERCAELYGGRDGDRCADRGCRAVRDKVGQHTAENAMNAAICMAGEKLATANVTPLAIHSAAPVLTRL